MRELLRKRLLWVAATDSTFERMTSRDGEVLSGKCIHCRKRLLLSLDGQPLSRATLEHIIPRTHGGTNRAENLAIACSSCNAHKGRTLDCRALSDPDLQRVIATLQERRRERWREPMARWSLPDPPAEWSD